MDILGDKNMLITAIDALKKEQQKRVSKKKENNIKQLFADDEGDSREKIFLVLSLIKLPTIPKDGKVAPMTIKSPIPHSFVDKFTNVLLITRDLKGDGKDSEPTIYKFKNKLKNHDALGLISEIMPLSQLYKEYSDFEARRNLARQFDIVLCDKKIIGSIARSLGKPFYSMKKRPLQVNLESKDLKETIEKCLSRSILHLNLEGSCSTVQIGRMNQSSEDLANNILSTITTWKELMPGGWINIRSINLKSETSKSLPLLVSTTLSKDVPNVVNPYALEDDIIAVDTVTGVETVKKKKKAVVVKRFGDVDLVPYCDEGRSNYFKELKNNEMRQLMYDPVTNNIVKDGEIVTKKERVMGFWDTIKSWRKESKQERYFKNKDDSTKGKGPKGNISITEGKGPKGNNSVTKGKGPKRNISITKGKGKKGNISITKGNGQKGKDPKGNVPITRGKSQKERMAYIKSKYSYKVKGYKKIESDMYLKKKYGNKIPKGTELRKTLGVSTGRKRKGSFKRETKNQKNKKRKVSSKE